MSSIISWDTTIDSKPYSLSYERLDGRHVVSVNGTPIEVKERLLSILLGFDEKFTFDGIEARLLVKCKSSESLTSRFDFIPDIAVNGILLNRKKKYIKRANLLWVFAIAAACSTLSLWGGECFLAAYVVIGVLAFRYKPSSLSGGTFASVLVIAIFVCSLLLFLFYSIRPPG